MNVYNINPMIEPAEVNTLEPFLKPLFQYICQGVQKEVLGQANKNFWRGALCNTMAQNNWNNQLTLRVQAMAIHTFRFLVVNTGRWNALQQLAEQAVVNVVTYACGLVYEMLAQQNSLGQINGQDQQSGALALNSWRQNEGNINQFINQGMWLQPPNQIANVSNMGNVCGVNRYVDTVANTGNIGNALFSPNTGTAIQPVTHTHSRYDDYPTTATPSTKDVAVNIQAILGQNGNTATQPTSAPEQMMEEPAKPLTTEDWKPSRKQPIFTAYHLNRARATYAEENGDIVQHVEGKPMDYTSHIVPTSLKQPNAEINVMQADRAVTCLEAVTVAALEATDPLADDETKFVAEEDFIIDPKPIIATSYGDAWIAADIARLKHQDDWKMPTVYRTTALIAQAYLAPTDNSKLLKTLEACNDFDELGKALKKVSLDATRLPELVRDITTKLTQSCNRAVRQNLSLTNVSIGNVVDDYDDLVAWIMEFAGRDVFAKFYVNQGRVIKNAFPDLTDTERETLDALVLKGEKFEVFEQKPVATYLAQRVTLTHVDIPASYLAIEMSDGRPALVKESLIPSIYGIAKHLFTETPHISEFDRHFLRTSDGVVYELSNGWLPFTDEEPAYIITLIG